jgi:hypothetical protein
MNEIIDKYPKIQDKLVYLMMEPEYTPITIKELKCIIKNNVWYPLYDNDSLLDTTNKLLTYLTNVPNDEQNVPNDEQECIV